MHSKEVPDKEAILVSRIQELPQEVAFAQGLDNEVQSLTCRGGQFRREEQHRQ